MLSCPNCGKETPADVAFCSSCGTRLNVISSSSQSVPSPPSAVTEVPISYIVQTATIPFDKKASRLELLVRIVWHILIWLVGVVYSIVFWIIVLVYGIIASILNIINFFVILITGKRWKTAFDWQAKLITKSVTYSTRLYNYWTRRAPYLGLMTDKRPELGMEAEPSKTPGGSPA
ncbi:MAG: zinc-ribbon domain-containing protein [Candidatus Bathyarchaeia archaeon]